MGETETRADQDRSWRSRELVLACCSLGCLLLPQFGFLLVVQGVVIPLSGLAVLLAVAALVTRRLARRRDAPSAPRGTLLVTVLGLGAGLLSTASAAVFTTYSLHPAASPQGCRVVAAEHAWFMSGGGAVYLLRGTTGLARRVGEYKTDDGDTPFAYGTADLTWDGEAAIVEGPFLWSFDGDAVAYRC